MIELYINNKKVDLDDNVDIKLNKKLEDVVNPTIIKTTFSRNVNIPKTNNNNKIFSHYYRFDKILGLNDFNANQRVPYILFDNSEIIMKGYLKLNKVSENYEVTLFDETADLLRTISTKKVLDILPQLNHTINRGTVISSWDYIPESFEDTGSTYDYISYVPAYKGTYENFSNSKLENASGTVVDIGYDVDEFDRQEFRSYYQCPAIYYNKIIKGICDSNNIRLHNDFHNPINPYWTDTVVMFPKLLSNSDKISKSTFSMIDSGIINYFVNSGGTIIARYVGTPRFNENSDPYNILNPLDTTKFNLINYPSGQVKIDYEFKIKLKFKGGSAYINKSLLPVDWANPNSLNIFKIRSYFEGQLNSPTEMLYSPLYGQTYPTLIARTDADGDGYLEAFKIFNLQGGIPLFSLGDVFTIKGTAIVPITATGKLRFDIDIFKNTVSSAGVIGVVDLGLTDSNGMVIMNPIQQNFNILSEIVESNISTCVVSAFDFIRSGGNVNKYNIVPDSLLQGDMLLNHIKQFGLLLDKDKDGYIIKSRNTFFSEGKILNWSDKVDYNSQIDLEPIAYDKKYQMLQYEPNNTTHYKNYSEISKVPFADFKINTSYEFNEDEDELYKSKFNCPLISQEYTFDRTNKKWRRLDYIAPAMHTISEEKKIRAEAPMTLLFKQPSVYLNEHHIDYPTKLTKIFVSDDSITMGNNTEFTWCDNTGFTTPYVSDNLSKFPYFNSITQDFKYSLEFGKNLIYYNSAISDFTYDENITIYNKLFKKWIEDRYSFNTKVITCNVYLTQNEFKNIKLNSFVMIDNTLFIIISINDFNIIQEGLTKVELLKVNDINDYLKGQNIVSENLIASTLNIDFATGQLVETTTGNEHITFKLYDPNLYYKTLADLYGTTIQIKEGNVIKSE